jgi:hypothetical protein
MRKAISQKVSVGEQPRQAHLAELKKEGGGLLVISASLGRTPPYPRLKSVHSERNWIFNNHHLPNLWTNSTQLRSENYDHHGIHHRASAPCQCAVSRAPQCGLAVPVKGLPTKVSICTQDPNSLLRQFKQFSGQFVGTPQNEMAKQRKFRRCLPIRALP